MTKEKILKILNEKYPLVKWTVEETKTDFDISGSYELKASTRLSKNVLSEVVFGAPDLVDDVGKGYYNDLRQKVTTFPS